MTPDPVVAVLDQLAASREHLAELDSREAPTSLRSAAS
jgi:hypothetical protein